VKRYDKLILLLLVVVFGGGIIFTARGAFSTYSTFAEAKERNRSVQVKGVAVDGSWREIDAGAFSFKLKDLAGVIYTVTHSGEVPANLFTAEYVVVGGRFDAGVFAARNILVKCPTRFMQQGAG